MPSIDTQSFPLAPVTEELIYDHLDEEMGTRSIDSLAEEIGVLPYYWNKPKALLDKEMIWLDWLVSPRGNKRGAIQA